MLTKVYLAIIEEVNKKSKVFHFILCKQYARFNKKHILTNDIIETN